MPADAWSRRHASRAGQGPRPGAGPAAAPRAGDRRRCGRTCPPDAAVPRLHKAAHYARRALGDRCRQRRWCSATTWSPCSPAPTSSSTPSQFRAAGGGGRWPRVRRTRAAEALDAVRRAAAARRPLRAVEPGAARGPAGCCTCDLLRLAGRWEECCRRTPPTSRPTWRSPAATSTGATPRRAAAARAPRPGPAPRARHRPERRTCSRAAQRGAGRHGRAAGRPRRPVRGAARGWSVAATSATRSAARLDRADAGRGSTLLVTGPPGRGQVRGPRPGRRAGPAARLADRARHGLRGRGAVAVRTGARGARRPLPPAPRPARRPRRQLPRRDRAGPVGPGRRLERRDRPTSGCSSPPPSCCGWRPPATALLLVVDDVHEADEASLRLLHYLARCAVAEPVLLAAGAPARHRRRRCGGAGQPGGPRHRRACSSCAPLDHVATTAAARRTRFPHARRGDARADLRRQRRPAVHACWRWPRRRRAGRRRRACSGAAAAGRCGPSSGSRCSARRSPPTSCWRWPASAEEETYRHLDDRAGRAGGRARRRAATASGTPWCARRCSQAMPVQAQRRAPGVRSPSSWPRSGAAPARVAHQFLAAGPPVARGAVRDPRGGDRRRARRLPRRARPGRRGAGPRTGRGPCRGCWPGAATC